MRRTQSKRRRRYPWDPYSIHQDMNALAEDQTLRFSPGLTVVYGDNGAGEMGYIPVGGRRRWPVGVDRFLDRTGGASRSVPAPSPHFRI
jgi:hypothetical protein